MSRFLLPLVMGTIASFLLAAVVGCHKEAPSSRTFHEPTPSNTSAGFTSVQGEKYEIPNKHAHATALIFVSSTCPIANKYAPEINRLTRDYQSRGVEILLVHTEPALSLEAAKQHLHSFDYECPVLLDPQRRLVEQTGATITPEVAVLSPVGELLYLGRIDDRFPDIGVQREKPTTTELRDALDAILAGQPVPVERTQAVGCFIE